MVDKYLHRGFGLLLILEAIVLLALLCRLLLSTPLVALGR